MAGILIVVAMMTFLYTVFAPAFTAEMRHQRYGLLLLLVEGVFAFVLHLAGML